MIFRKGPVSNALWSEEETLIFRPGTRMIWQASIGTVLRRSIVQVEVEPGDFDPTFDEIKGFVENWLTGETREATLQMIAQAIVTTNPDKEEQQ